MVGTIDIRDLAPGDAGWVIQRHAELYAAQDGFDASFEALVARILADYLSDHDPARERAFIAWEGGRRVGSVFCVAETETRAKLRLFLLEPEMRGRGLGRRLLAACMGFARDAGYREMGLWTHESHRAACALYAATGFRMISARPVVSFGQPLVEQMWQIDLTHP